MKRFVVVLAGCLVAMFGPGIGSASAAVPANDAFANARTISGTSVSFSADNFGATHESGEPTHGGYQGGGSVWFSWTAPSDGNLYLSVGDFNSYPVLAVYVGTDVADLTGVVTNTSYSTWTYLNTPVTAGITYRIAVDSQYAYFDGFSLSLQLYPTAPVNDHLAASQLITGQRGSARGATFGASKESSEPYHGGQYGGHSIWFRWTAPASGSVTFDTAGSEFDTVLGIYRGTNYTKLTAMVSNDDCDIDTPTSCGTFTATQGVTYRIAVDGFNGEVGRVTLNWLMLNACTVEGGAGDDTLVSTSANDVICGYGGIDTVSYANAASGVTVDLPTGRATGDGTDTLSGIENVSGSSFGDKLDGDAGDNALDGKAGNDIVAGHEGNDSVIGGLGNDSLYGGVGINTVDGGADVDTVGYGASPSGIVVDLVAGTATGYGDDRLSGVENVIGSKLADKIDGDAAGNAFNGGPGNDILAGKSGNDALTGGVGNDALFPGGGNDVARGDSGVDSVGFGVAPNAVSVNLSAGTVTGWGSMTLASIENVTGSKYNDTLKGSAATNVILGGSGNDSLNVQDGRSGDTADGGLGTDSCSVDVGDTRISCP